MIVDSSAFVAVLLDEPEGARFREILAAAAEVRLSAATLTECGIVLSSQRGLFEDFEELLRVTAAEVIPVDEALARVAIMAHDRYGRGSGSPARLNYGDCFSYALATARDEPLLFKGDDFVHTDVRSALDH